MIKAPSATPSFETPDGVSFAINVAFHPSLGNGTGLSSVYVNFLPPDGTFVRIVLYCTLIFPAEPFP